MSIEPSVSVSEFADVDFRRLFAPEPLSEASVQAAEQVLRDGRLFRYDAADAASSPAARLEHEFADRLGCRWALAVNSCGSAMQLALLAAGARPGDDVLVPAFTFTAVVSAIVNCGCNPVLVDIRDDYCLDVDDLRRKHRRGTRFLLMSYMRGRVARLDALLEFCESNGVVVVEDCAHSLGTSWHGRPTGTFGAVSCFSFHDKLLSSGEGGMLCTDDEHLLMRAVVMSGTYERLWQKHLSHPPVDNPYQGHVAQFSMRMSAVTAAILRPQIPLIDANVAAYRGIHAAMAARLARCARIRLPDVDDGAQLVSNTIQFELRGLDDAAAAAAVAAVGRRGIPLARFGPLDRNDRCVWNWHYLAPGAGHGVPHCRRLLRNTCDLRLRRTMTGSDAEAIADAIVAEVDAAARAAPGPE